MAYLNSFDSKYFISKNPKIITSKPAFYINLSAKNSRFMRKNAEIALLPEKSLHIASVLAHNYRT